MYPDTPHTPLTPRLTDMLVDAIQRGEDVDAMVATARDRADAIRRDAAKVKLATIRRALRELSALRVTVDPAVHQELDAISASLD